ncbi:MAG: response regulator transcription factor [Ginsengibacter sp.]
MTIPIAIIDDNFQNRRSLAERLEASQNIEVKFTAVNGNDFLEIMKNLNSNDYPHVILMDIEMPGMNGIEAVRLGKQLYPQIKFLMLTVFDDDDKIFEAIKAGASGYLLKDEKVVKIIECVHQIVELDGAPMSPTIARKAINMLMNAGESNVKNSNSRPLQNILSEREMEILKLLVEGNDYRASAEKLFLSTHTVRKHIANIYGKLHVTSKAMAIHVANKNNMFNG